MTIRLAVIIGSTRPGRRTTAVADWVAHSARTQPAIAAGEASVDLVDLADYNLPLFDERLPPMMGQYENAHTRRWAETIGSYDGFIFVTPEYNHSMPAALKNAIDYLFAEWHHKPAGILSYGLAGGVRAAEHLKSVLLEVKTVPVGTQVALSVFDDFSYTDDTDPASPFEVTARDHQTSGLLEMLEEILTYSRALAPLRISDPDRSTAELTEAS